MRSASRFLEHSRITRNARQHALWAGTKVCEIPSEHGQALSSLTPRCNNGTAIPIFVALLLLVFDAGLGYSASHTWSSAARSAARVGALARDARHADSRVRDALRAQLGSDRADSNDGGVSTIVVYRSDPGNPNGAPPAGCLVSSTAGPGVEFSTVGLVSLTAIVLVVGALIVRSRTLFDD